MWCWPHHTSPDVTAPLLGRIGSLSIRLPAVAFNAKRASLGSAGTQPAGEDAGVSQVRLGSGVWCKTRWDRRLGWTPVPPAAIRPGPETRLTASETVLYIHCCRARWRARAEVDVTIGCCVAAVRVTAAPVGQRVRSGTRVNRRFVGSFFRSMRAKSAETGDFGVDTPVICGTSVRLFGLVPRAAL